MPRRTWFFSNVFLIHFVVLAAQAEPLMPGVAKTPIASLANLPLGFEQNQGQSDKEILYLFHGSGHSIYLLQSGMSLALDSPSHKRLEVIQIGMEGANPKAQPEGVNVLPGTVNYYIGRDPAQWQTNIRVFRQIHYPHIYPGTDLVFYGNRQHLEFDFDLAAGVDAAAIRLKVTGATVQQSGRNLELICPSGRKITLRQPELYQETGKGRRRVSGGYLLRSDGKISFFIGAHDRHRPLIIDPALVYSTFAQTDFTDAPVSVAIDNQGAAYATGQSLIQGATGPGSSSVAAFIMKFDTAGSSLIYKTFLGGNSFPPQGFPQNVARGDAISVDSLGNAYVVGVTSEPDFPTTANTYSPNPFCTSQGQNLGCIEPFAAKFRPAGTVAFSTYLVQPSKVDTSGPVPSAMAVDSTGAIYVTGTLSQQKFSTADPPLNLAGLTTTAGAFQTIRSNASSDFVLKLHPDGSKLDYATYLGGSNAETPGGIAVDLTGIAYIDGGTSSSDFPVTANAFQKSITSRGGFFTKLSADGASLVFSTFLGDQSTAAWAIALDSTNAAYLTGDAGGSFPTSSGAFKTTPCSCNFVTKFDSANNLSYSTLIGPGVASSRESETGLARVSATSIAVDASGAAYISAFGSSNSYPLVQALQTSPSIFVTKLQSDGSGLIYSTFFGPANVPPAENPFAGMALDITHHTVAITGLADDGQDPNTMDPIPGVATTAAAFQSTPSAAARSPRMFVAKIADSLGSAAPAPNPRTIVFSTVQQQGTTSTPRMVHLINYGDSNLIINSITLSGANASDFAIASNMCGSSLAMGGNCTFFVTFTPTVPTGTRNAVVNLSFGGGLPSQTVTLTGSAPGNGSFNVMSRDGVTSATLSAGQTATYNLTVVAGSSFSGSGPITLSCAGAPAVASCNANPNSISVPAGQGIQQNVLVSVATTAPTSAARRTGPRLSGVLAVAVGIVFLCPRNLRLRRLLLMILSLTLFWAMLSCGGGNSVGSGGVGMPGTPRGTYMLTVTANANGVSNNLPLTLTVQ